MFVEIEHIKDGIIYQTLINIDNIAYLERTKHTEDIFYIVLRSGKTFYVTKQWYGYVESALTR